MDNGTTRVVVSEFVVRVAATPAAVEQPGTVTGHLFDGAEYCATGTGFAAYDGCKAAGYQYGIYYANPSVKQLTNPVIVVDGFDVNEDRGVADIFNFYLNKDIDGRPRLAQSLRAQGYDVVIFNYRDSKDFIQRNAYALEKLIQWVNSQIQPSGGRIRALVGVSMGGLVSRYALLHMESQGLTHNVNTFVSYDSPQQGGNIPLGMPYHLSHIPGLAASAGQIVGSPDPRAFVEMFRKPATRQLLTVGMPHGSNDPYRRALYDEIWAMGDYPDATRNVAVVNGSGTGRPQVRTNNSSATVGPGGHMINQVFRGTLFGFGLSLEIDSYTVPNRTARVVERNVTRACVPILGCIKELDTDENSSLPNVLPYDGAPGGYRASQEDLNANPSPVLGSWWEAITGIAGFPDVDSRVYIERHAFITTTSALDYATDGSTRQALNQSLFLNQNVLKSITQDTPEQRTARTPFDAFFLPGVTPSRGDTNQVHVGTSDPNISDFLLAQLAITPPFFNAQITASSTLNGIYRGTTTVLNGATVTVPVGVTTEVSGVLNAAAGGTVTVRGRLVLKQGASFEGRYLYVAAGGELVVEPGVVLT